MSSPNDAGSPSLPNYPDDGDGWADSRTIIQTRRQLPIEIPDSQNLTPSLAENWDPENFSEPRSGYRASIEDNDLDSTCKLGTEHEFDIPHIPKEPTYRYPLHQRGLDVNGCVPSEAPTYYYKGGIMDDHPTQQATQQYEDPRKLGTKSMLSLQDEADILCILLPTSGTALRTVDLVAETTPQHLLQNHWLEGIPEASYEGNDVATTTASLKDEQIENAIQRTGPKGFNGGAPPAAKDIALRMSSKLRNSIMGFVFGRNHARCDIVVPPDIESVSNCHFRIFLNDHGVLMLEDTSTNGTLVDKTLLMQAKKDKLGNPCPATRTLTSGSMIEFPVRAPGKEDWIRFVVRMPRRDHGEKQYLLNLAAYQRYTQQAKRQAEVALAAKGNLPPAPPMPFNPLNQELQDDSPHGSILAAATGEYNHGMHWHGGDKFNVVSYIGKGAFAQVFKISTILEGIVYAAKQIEKRRFVKDGQMGSKIHHEISIMERLRHPNIVQFIEYHDTPSYVYIIMEYIPMGDLTTYTGSGTAMNEYMAQVMASQICDALKYLHEQSITHRDVKPDNILMASHQPYTFKLSDFGLSKIVKDEETFLKTFCGTILYCAPEIYPGFQRVRLGMPPKRSRHWEHPREETLPYKHSVDTWGIAAVLFHLLCGRPAWTGTTENQGAVMLENIMRTPVEWERLEQAGVSPTGIDFLQRMLVIEPTERANEEEQLRHPWIRQGTNLQDSVMENDGLKHDEDPGLDASQLSLVDNHVQNDDDDDDLDDMGDPRQSKRLRGWSPAPPINPDGTLRPRDGDSDGEEVVPWGPNHPAWGFAEEQQSRDARPLDATNRLFGEISESALRSSGALGQNANAALNLNTTTRGDPGGAGYSNISSLDANYPAPESLSAHPLPPHPRHVTEYAYAQQYHHPQYRQPDPPESAQASSLLGAEALVDQLNMASPKSGFSGPSMDSREASDKASFSRDVSPSQSGSKRSSRQFQSARKTSIIKKPRTRDGPASAGSAGSGGSAPPSRDGDSRRRPSSRHQERSAQSMNRIQARTQDERTATTESSNASRQSRHDSYSNVQRVHGASKSGTSILPTAFNSQDTQPLSLFELKDGAGTLTASNAGKATTTPGRLPGSSGDTSTILRRDQELFREPPFRFGNLVPLPGSIPTVRIKIANQVNSFGRDPDSTFPHPDLKADRVPKNALDITMYYPGIEGDIQNGSTNWHLHEDLTAIISTRTTRYIKVNGVRLMRGNECWLYGKLHTGDIITIFEAPEGREPKNEAEKMFLKFRCEFFVGASKAPRSEDDPFSVMKAENLYGESGLRRSQEQLARSVSRSN